MDARYCYLVHFSSSDNDLCEDTTGPATKEVCAWGKAKLLSYLFDNLFTRVCGGQSNDRKVCLSVKILDCNSPLNNSGGIGQEL